MSHKKFKAAPSISALRLEAIFHPKFENETPSSEIRARMLAKASASEGRLEASLKHSGSLLLWSGRRRFYSKNGAGNAFAKVGEIALMRHFARCHGPAWREEYERCGECVRRRRLTCSFEVVTSALGHHGDLPRRDYLILVAVADRTDGRGAFYGSNELVRFAHRFRLPHNDVWVFASGEACQSLFRVYDQMRETGTAGTVIEQLDRIVSENEGGDGEPCCCAKVASLYPHDVFQGDILEGIVIRYVPYRNIHIGNCDGDTSSTAKQKQSMDEMKGLCDASNELLRLVPPSTTLNTSSADENSIERVDLRALAATDDFEQQLENVLCSIHGSNRRQTHNADKNTEQDQTQSASRSIDVVNIANEILVTSSGNPDVYDQETLAIARLIRNLHQLKIPVSYKVLTEKSSSEGDSDERCICILHIHHDSSFRKYHNFLEKQQNKGMLLYRGFSIELVPEGCDSNTKKMDVESDATEIESDPHGEQLMLKMKFLPYMVRTFICRNGLSTLQRSGVHAFVDYAISQLKKWDVSEAAVRKWMPFFKGWAKYCTSPPSTSLPPLTEQNYLHHYNEFATLYENGQFQPDLTGHATFNGLVVVVGRTRSNLEALSLAVSKELNCSKVVRDIHSITDKDVLLSLPDSGGGLLCIAEVEDGFGNLRKLAKRNHEAIYIVMVEADQDELNMLPNKNLQKFNGMVQGWKKTKCNMLLDLPKDSAMLSTEDAALEYLRSDSVAKEAMTKLKTSSEKNQRDERPGVIVYFPSIPGSGKSSLCNGISAKSLGMGNDRELIILEGDKVQGKFYNAVTQEILTKPASVVILDKNVPPASFSSVHSACVESKSIAMPVVPCGMEDTLVGSYTYPLTLQYLAVCMSRVLKRQPNSHSGKLDSATDTACMVVVKFYCLYRNMTTCVMRERVMNIGHNCKPIIVPFFEDNGLADLPADLQSTLVNSIILQTQDDVGVSKVSHEDIMAMEKDLRASIQEHQIFIDKMTVSLDTSKKAFESELSRAIASLPEQLEALNIAEDKMTRSIKIASLDFDSQDVSNVIEQLRRSHPEVELYFAQRNEHKCRDENDKSQDRFVTSTHCTFAHETQLTQAAMTSSFKHLIGTSFEVNATALLFSDKIAAIQLEIRPPNPSVPLPCNKFAHITVWCAADTEAFESNSLPEKVQCNEARRILFEKPVVMKGVFSFWYN